MREDVSRHSMLKEPWLFNKSSLHEYRVEMYGKIQISSSSVIAMPKNWERRLRREAFSISK